MSKEEKTRARKRSKEALRLEVLRLSRDGTSDLRIAGILGIHRTTVKKYREQADKEDISRAARIELARQALSQHFSDLAGIIQRTEGELAVPQPRHAAIDDLGTPGNHSLITLDNRVSISWELKDNVVLLCLPVERELLFQCLKQHTQSSLFWELFLKWKESGGKYLNTLSALWVTIKHDAEDKTGLRISAKPSEDCITRNFPLNVYEETCSKAFSGNTFWPGIAYEINHAGDRFELRQGATRLASSAGKQDMERCRRIHSEMMAAQTNPAELRNAIILFKELKDIEPDISLELEKLRLKKTFPRRCDLCPDQF